MISPNGKNLIFLMSQPRAGSTLLQLMLSGHTEIATTSEPWIALHPLYALRDRGLLSEFDSLLARRALGDFLKQSGADTEFYMEQVAVFLSALYTRAAAHQGKKFFLDKTPRYYHIIDDLAEVFPEAKFIILLRNPLAVLNSILKTWVRDNTMLLGHYKRDLMTAPRKLTECLRNRPDRCLRVSYENLVQMPEETLKDICEYLGIAFSPGLIDYGGREKPDSNFGDPVGVHRASRPSAAGLDSWKKGIGSPQKRLFAASYLEELGAKLVEEMGYDYGALMGQVGMDKGEARGLISWKEVMAKDTIDSADMILDQMDALRNSLSWKITAPLRSGLDVMKRSAKGKK